MSMMNAAAEVRALVVSPDPSLASVFLDIGRELGLVLDTSDGHSGVPRELGCQKYEALVLDFDGVVDSVASLAALRSNPSNQNAVVFAVATAPAQQQAALLHGANFVLPRPLNGKELRRTLYAAYDAMTRERRRYFRCTAELPVFITRADGSELAARSANVSTHGLSICSPVSFNLGERLGITLDLQNGSPHVLAHGTVVWDDKHGKSGLNFQCIRPELQKLLDAWLDHEFQKVRESAVREFHKARSAQATGR